MFILYLYCRGVLHTHSGIFHVQICLILGLDKSSPYGQPISLACFSKVFILLAIVFRLWYKIEQNILNLTGMTIIIVAFEKVQEPYQYLLK